MPKMTERIAGTVDHQRIGVARGKQVIWCDRPWSVAPRTPAMANPMFRLNVITCMPTPTSVRQWLRMIKCGPGGVVISITKYAFRILLASYGDPYTRMNNSFLHSNSMHRVDELVEASLIRANVTCGKFLAWFNAVLSFTTDCDMVLGCLMFPRGNDARGAISIDHVRWRGAMTRVDALAICAAPKRIDVDRDVATKYIEMVVSMHASRLFPPDLDVFLSHVHAAIAFAYDAPIKNTKLAAPLRMVGRTKFDLRKYKIKPHEWRVFYYSPDKPAVPAEHALSQLMVYDTDDYSIYTTALLRVCHALETNQLQITLYPTLSSPPVGGVRMTWKDDITVQKPGAAPSMVSITMSDYTTYGALACALDRGIRNVHICGNILKLHQAETHACAMWLDLINAEKTKVKLDYLDASTLRTPLSTAEVKILKSYQRNQVPGVTLVPVSFCKATRMASMLLPTSPF